MGFFLYDILGRMMPLAQARGDGEHAVRYAEHREHLCFALNNAGWDGDWYRRATYDNGAWLGSATNDECQIDALAQAWSVLSGAAPPARVSQALDAMERQLVDEDAGLIRLLTPAFDTTPHDPGYIKGYVPGVRENGGQYTHAALWAVRALAEAGRCERAARLLAMLSPVSHGDTPAGWVWRVAVESILGLTLDGGSTLVLRPCIPSTWPGFSVRYRLPDGSAVLAITVTRGELAATLDRQPVDPIGDGVRISLPRDGAEHALHLTLP
jgi:cyclic beta-1,2-glucan synthetase